MDKIPIGSVTLVLLPLKYEIDDSVSVTVRGSVTGGGGALYAYERDIQVRRRSIVNSTYERCRHRNLQDPSLRNCCSFIISNQFLDCTSRGLGDGSPPVGYKGELNTNGCKLRPMD